MPGVGHKLVISRCEREEAERKKEEREIYTRRIYKEKERERDREGLKSSKATISIIPLAMPGVGHKLVISRCEREEAERKKEEREIYI